MGTVVVGEEVAVAEGLEGGDDVWPEGRAVGFEVDEEDHGLLGCGIENASPVGGGAVEEGGYRVLPFEDFDKGIDVEAAEGAVLGQAGFVMADVEFVVVVEEPDVGFDAYAARFDGIEERDQPPVVVVGMAGYGENVASEVGRVMS